MNELERIISDIINEKQNRKKIVNFILHTIVGELIELSYNEFIKDVSVNDCKEKITNILKGTVSE